MRNKTLFLYNGTLKDQEWSVFVAGQGTKSYTVGQLRKSFTLSFKGDATIQFGVDDTVYLSATYTYSTDSWTHNTVTPNEFSFIVTGSAISVTCSYDPDVA